MLAQVIPQSVRRLLCLAAALYVLPCAAQQPDLSQASLEDLGNIPVYSASRHLEPSGAAPSSVSVITYDEIQQHGYRTLADVLQAVRGFYVIYDRNYSSVGVRGFARPGDFNTRILLLVDGHRFNDNVFDDAMVGTEFPMDLDLVDKIEIVRGPVSSLYGSNALFAVINVITRRGSDFNGWEGSSAVASFNTYKGRVSYGQAFNRLEFMLSGSFYGSRGPNRLFFPEFDSPATNNGIASHADDDQLASALSTVSYRGFTFQALYGTRQKGIPTASYETVFNDAGSRTTDDHTYFDLRYQHTFKSGLALTARTYFDRYTYQGIYMHSAPLPSFGKGSPANTPNIDGTDGKWWGLELQASRTLWKRNRITAGGEYRNNLRQDQVNYDPRPTKLLINDHRSSFAGGPYVQDELRLTRALTLNAGVRFDAYSYSDSSIDPRAALVYQPREGTILKFIYGEAFRVPNVYELYNSVPPGLPNPALRPEKIRALEFDWEQNLTRRAWLSISAFRNSMDDLITQQLVENDRNMFMNLDSAVAMGMEGELRGQLVRGMEGKASYTFVQAKDQATGALLSNAPKHLAKFDLTQPFVHKKLLASVNVQYRGRMHSFEGCPMPSLLTLNATLLARDLGRGLEFSASVYNLLDKPNFDPPSDSLPESRVPLDGRTFQVKMTWHFGGR